VVAKAGGSGSQAADVERAEVHQQMPETLLVRVFIVVAPVLSRFLYNLVLGLLQECLLRHSVRLQGTSAPDRATTFATACDHRGVT